MKNLKNSIYQYGYIKNLFSDSYTKVRFRKGTSNVYEYVGNRWVKIHKDYLLTFTKTKPRK